MRIPALTAALLVSALFITFASACGGGGADTTDQDVAATSGGAQSSGGDTAGAAESCAGYAPGDACIDESNFAQCQEMEAQCPGQVVAMESCPLQFACPN